MDLSKQFVTAKTDETIFRVSISWPLDSGNDKLDSDWGTKAYEYKLAKKRFKSIKKYMNCNKCGTNTEVNTFTTSNESYSSTATADKSKSGVGAARITLIDNSSN